MGGRAPKKRDNRNQRNLVSFSNHILNWLLSATLLLKMPVMDNAKTKSHSSQPPSLPPKRGAKADRQNDPCPVARALNDVGDWWSLLIVRQAMYGTRRYGDFQKQLGIAKNILCDRLTRLVDNDVLKKVDIGEHGQRFEYRLTEKGKDLFPVLVALRQWGDKWNREEGDVRVPRI